MLAQMHKNHPFAFKLSRCFQVEKRTDTFYVLIDGPVKLIDAQTRYSKIELVLCSIEYCIYNTTPTNLQAYYVCISKSCHGSIDLETDFTPLN